jgi:hypothetical protein
MANDPVLIAYAARRGRKGRVEYARIGRAYPHDRGSGLTLILDALPIKGWHLILLELDESHDRRLLAKVRQREQRHTPARRQKRDPS